MVGPGSSDRSRRRSGHPTSGAAKDPFQSWQSLIGCTTSGSTQSGAGTPKWRSVLQRLLTAGGACRDGFPFSVVEQAEILEDLVDCAERHFKNTGRYLQVWGELGEIYAEVKFGLCRAWHPPSWF